jgi:sugar (pentulose or hexulose) kinase
MSITIGIDIGSGAVKSVLFRSANTSGWQSASSAFAGATR